MIKETVQYPEILNATCFVDFRQETCFSVSVCTVRHGFADKLLKFPPLISGLLLYSEKIRECCLDFFFFFFLVLDHYPCHQVTQMQSCLCQSSPGRTAVTSHGLGQVLTAECPRQHTHPVSRFSAYMCSAPVRADDLPTQVN